MIIRKSSKELLKVILVAILYIFTSCTDQSNVNEKLINISPKPLKVEAGIGSFTIEKSTKILVETNNKDARNVAKYFADRVKTVIGYDLTIENYKAGSSNSETIVIKLKMESKKPVILSRRDFINRLMVSGTVIGGMSLFWKPTIWCWHQEFSSSLPYKYAG